MGVCVFGGLSDSWSGKSFYKLHLGKDLNYMREWATWTFGGMLAREACGAGLASLNTKETHEV